MPTARGSGLTRAAKAKAAGHKSGRHESEATRKKISEGLKRYYAEHPRRGHETAAQKAAERAEKARHRKLTKKQKAELRAARLKAAAARRLAKAKADKKRKAARAALLAKQRAERLRQAATVRANRKARAEHAVAKSALIKALAAAKTRHRMGPTAGRHHFRGRSATKALVHSHIRRNLKGTLHTHRRRSRAGLLHKTARHHRTHHVWRKKRRR